MARLHAEPLIALDPNAIYASPEHLAFAVAQLVARVQGIPDPSYVLNTADTYPFEAPAQGLAGWVDAFMQQPTGLTFIALAGDRDGFMYNLGAIEFVLFGRVLSAQRDAPGSPLRHADSTSSQSCHAQHRF